MTKRAPARPPKATLRIRLLKQDGEPYASDGLTLIWGKQKIPVQLNVRGEVVPFGEAEKASPKPLVVPRPPVEGLLLFRGVLPWGHPYSAKNYFWIRVFLADFGEADKAPGTKARLHNLGYLSLRDDPKTALAGGMDAEAEGALARFREANGIFAPAAAPAGATMDAATRDRLLDAHDNAGGPLEKP